MGKSRRMIGLAVVCLGVLVPAAVASASQYVDLGDSYASGVGTRVFYESSGSCKRSPEAYGPKVAAAKAYSLNFEACSGAKTTDVNEKQLGNLKSTTALVTISIGGNDAGFSNVILNCALYYFTCGSAINEANSYIATKLGGVLDTTYNNIRSRATTAHVVVLGYPHLFTDTGTTCNVNFLTSSNEKKLNETGDKLDAKLKERAGAHGFTFVDPRSAFKPHAVCSSEEWLNGQSNPLEESYHPNVKGHVELTKEVEARLP
ncbi:MAG TPA: SGNH/GDSL hydrolase family protein [Solirubrobacteraceae bacterium]|nr:SGNH/GDSL hydrolase family protein [Solirubrobacteraceae bacterium]